MKKRQRIACILVLLLSMSLFSSCIGSKKGRCKECPEFTKTFPHQSERQS